ncbi:MAG: hypothetical protein K1X67_10985 [Fimbriimonadaceae bacterium]|nr:hypothetical protein [Fimbriimonadaceae bacterium]
MRTLSTFLVSALAFGVLFGCGGGGEIPSGGLHDVPPTRADNAAIQRLIALRPLRGVGFQPAPSDYKGDGKGQYFDSDFYNEDYKQLWGPQGRNDIGNLRAAGVGFIHPYDWNPTGRNHKPFLDYCAAQNMCVAVPFSNYIITQMKNGNGAVQGWINNIVGEVYSGGTRNPSVILWTLGNEWDNTGGFFQPADIARLAQMIINAEDSLNIKQEDRIAFTCPVTFGVKFGNPVEGAGATLQLRDGFAAAGMSTVFQNRFVACVNSFNPGSDLGPWAATRFPQATNNIPFIMYEVGKEIGGVVNGTYSPDYGDVHDEAQQGGFYAAQIAALMPSTKTGPFLGFSMFSTVNEAFKGGTEATFGLYKISVPNARQGRTTKGENFPIDTWAEKPSFTAMKNAFLSN